MSMGSVEGHAFTLGQHFARATTESMKSAIPLAVN